MLLLATQMHWSCEGLRRLWSCWWLPFGEQTAWPAAHSCYSICARYVGIQSWSRLHQLFVASSLLKRAHVESRQSSHCSVCWKRQVPFCWTQQPCLAEAVCSNMYYAAPLLAVCWQCLGKHNAVCSHAGCIVVMKITMAAFAFTHCMLPR